jgi:hypothetical protein
MDVFMSRLNVRYVNEYCALLQEGEEKSTERKKGDWECPQVSTGLWRDQSLFSP